MKKYFKKSAQIPTLVYMIPFVASSFTYVQAHLNYQPYGKEIQMDSSKLNFESFVPPVSVTNGKTQMYLESTENWLKKRELILEKIKLIAGENYFSRQTSTPTAESMQIAWHYVSGIRFLDIMQRGVLMPTYCVGIDGPGDWKSYTFFSKNKIWEPTASRMGVNKSGLPRHMKKEEEFEIECGLVRFGYPSDLLLPWLKLEKKVTVRNSPYKKYPFNRRRKGGALPNQWFGSVSNIPLSELIIECMSDGKWVRIQDPAPESSGSHADTSDANILEDCAALA